MLSFKARQCSRTVNAFVPIKINIENPEADARASWNADHCIWPLTPPRLDQVGVGGRIFPAV